MINLPYTFLTAIFLIALMEINLFQWTFENVQVR